MSKEMSKELEIASKPLVDFIKKNYHPHAKVIVATDYVEVLEGSIIISVKCENCLCDKCPNACQDCVRCIRAEYACPDWEDYKKSECDSFDDSNY